MDKDLEQKLQKKFPFMKQNRVNGEINTYRRYGCECGDGWYNMICEMCQTITDRYTQDGIPIDLIPEQLKEKFATLRFYYSFKDAPCGIAAYDSLNGGTSIRFLPGNNTDDEKKAQLRQDIAQIVGRFEAKSKSVCEICGDETSAKIRTDLRWKRTFCDKCYQKRMEAMAELKKKKTSYTKEDFL